MLEEIERTRRGTLDPSSTEAEHPQSKGTPSETVPLNRDTPAPSTQHTKASHEPKEYAEAAHQVTSTDQGSSHKDQCRLKDGPVSRPKLKCHFGPKTRQGRERTRTSPSSRRDAPPSPPPSHTPPTLDDDWQNPPFGDVKGWEAETNEWIRSAQPDWITQELEPQIAKDSRKVLPDRPTFFHFTPTIRPPYAKYRKNLNTEVPTPSSPPPPFRHIHERLGLSEDEFQTRLQEEIDSILEPPEVICCERPCAHNEETPAALSDPSPSLTPMTK